MSKVSIITPAYNASSYLKETVESVLTQTFADWEMIIVDDCSTDNTFDLANELAKKDPRIKVFKSSKNIGVAAARNLALDIATGEYIAFLDSDDLWLPEKLQKQVHFMETGEYVLSYTNYKKFDSTTGRIHEKIIRAPEKMTARKIYGDTSIGCLTVMINRNRSGAFHMPLVKHTEDNLTWQEILARGYCGYRLDEVLSLYRDGNSSLTSSKWKAAMKQWETYRNYYKFSILKSLYYYISYAYHAIMKHFF